LTGIQGLDEITGGGLPTGRPTLLSGGAGAGKTLFGLEFLVRGATQYGEPGVFMSFEETIPDLTQNAASLGFDLDRLVAEKKIFLDHVHISRSEIAETGEYDLDGLFIRIADAVQRVGARRIVLDTIEALFGEMPNPGILRAEIRRLFDWLKKKGLTTVITAERDRPDKLTRHGIEEFVSDCVSCPGPSYPGGDLDPAPARGQVPGIDPWHERISLPHRSTRHFSPADLLAGPGPRGVPTHESRLA